MNLPVTDTAQGVRFAVRVTPRASRTTIQGIIGEGRDAALKIALQAPPLEGRANAALVEFLSDLLDIRRADIEIAGGQHARNKMILVRGRSAAEISSALERELESSVRNK